MCLLLVLLSWQQHVTYEIDASLDTQEHSVSAIERIVYYNRSPKALDTLYFQVFANAYQDAGTYFAREAYQMGNDRYAKARSDERGQMDIVKVTVADELLSYDIDETIMVLPLSERLDPEDSLAIEIEFRVKVPKEFPDFGYWPGHYEMTQWYPKICVFDEEGWHRDQLHPLASVYGEFGTYDVTIELPGDFVVAGGGVQIDPLEIQFLDTLFITGKKLPRQERKRVHFHAEKAHDFAWICGRDLRLKRYSVLNTNVNIFYRSGNEDGAETTYQYAFDAISRFTEWFGEYPYRELNFIDGFHQGKGTYPQMIITALNEDQVTRLFEVAVVTELGRQWFGGMIGIDAMRDAWLGEGFAAYSAIRYMTDKYGDDNTLIKLPLLPSLSLKYYHQFYYYLVQTNRLEKPVGTPVFEYVDVPISYQNSVVSKPALFLLALEKTITTEIFDKIIQRYYQTYAFRHVRPYDFIKICEEVSGQDLDTLFNSFLNTTEFCDWGVNDVLGNTVEIENKGNLKIPVDLHILTDSGKQLFHLDAQAKEYTVVVPDSLGEIQSAALDPHEYAMDPNYWNNYSPRKMSIKPIWDFDWPSFSTYQVFWTPYVWYYGYDGITAGLFLFGDNFADFDFVRGGYQVTAGYTYGFRSRENYPSLNYQTPVIFDDGRRVRIRFSGARSRGGDNISMGISTNLGRPFTRQPQMSITNTVSYNDLSTFSGLDSIDWDLGRNITFKNDFRLRHADFSVDVGLSAAHHSLGSEWEYLKITLEAKKRFEFAVPFSARLFVGTVFGEAPMQEKLFLSGALRTNFLTGLFFGQSGEYSPQEHVHIPGDGSMAGYQTLHIKSDQMYVLNLEFPARTLIRLFTDIGYYDKFAYDVGLRLVIGSETFPFLPLYGFSISVNLPVYSYVEDEPWAFRWSFGFSS